MVTKHIHHILKSGPIHLKFWPLNSCTNDGPAQKLEVGNPMFGAVDQRPSRWLQATNARRASARPVSCRDHRSSPQSGMCGISNFGDIKWWSESQKDTSIWWYLPLCHGDSWCVFFWDSLTRTGANATIGDAQQGPNKNNPVLSSSLSLATFWSWNLAMETTCVSIWHYL